MQSPPSEWLPLSLTLDPQVRCTSFIHYLCPKLTSLRGQSYVLSVGSLVCYLVRFFPLSSVSSGCRSQVAQGAFSKLPAPSHLCACPPSALTHSWSPLPTRPLACMAHSLHADPPGSTPLGIPFPLLRLQHLFVFFVALSTRLCLPAFLLVVCHGTRCSWGLDCSPSTCNTQCTQ